MARLQHNRCGDKEWPACYGRSGDDLPRPILIFVAAKKNGFACGGRSGNEVPRPILIFAAAKENGPPATVVAVTAIAVSDSTCG